MKTLAVRFLEVALDDTDRYDRRAYYARAAVRAGLTLDEIADIYETDKDHVREMIEGEDE